jgi:hypothetical protein
MLTQSLLFLGQLSWWDLAQGVQALGLGGQSGQQFPSAGALQSATGLPQLAGGAEQAALGIAEVTFQVIVGAGQPRQVIAMEEAGPIAGADFVQVAAKSVQARREVG